MPQKQFSYQFYCFVYFFHRVYLLMQSFRCAHVNLFFYPITANKRHRAFGTDNLLSDSKCGRYAKPAGFPLPGNPNPHAIGSYIKCLHPGTLGFLFLPEEFFFVPAREFPALGKKNFQRNSLEINLHWRYHPDLNWG